MSRRVIYRTHFRPEAGAPIGRPIGPTPALDPTDVDALLDNAGRIIVSDGVATIQIVGASEDPAGVPGTWRVAGALTTQQVRDSIAAIVALQSDPIPTVAATATEVAKTLRTQDRVGLLVNALTVANNRAIAEPFRSQAIRLAGSLLAAEMAESGVTK